jgi:hypothetical protein
MQNIPHIISVTAAVLISILPPAYRDDVMAAKTEALKSYAAAQAQAKTMVETGDFSAFNSLPQVLALHQKQFDAILPFAEMLVKKGYFDNMSDPRQSP